MYKINYIKLPQNDKNPCIDINNVSFEIFWNNNLSMFVCTAMVLGQPLEEISKYNNMHRPLYGKYLGGFCFEGFELLPPLCILNVFIENIPCNCVFYNNTIYDPCLGIFSASEYINKNQNVNIVGYVQIFIEEAYQGADLYSMVT